MDVLDVERVVLELTTDEAVVASAVATVDTESGETTTGETVVHARPESAVKARATTNTPVRAIDVLARRRPQHARRWWSSERCRVTRPRGSGSFILEV
jgi:hypothetical protein